MLAQTGWPLAHIDDTQHETREGSKTALVVTSEAEQAELPWDFPVFANAELLTPYQISHILQPWLLWLRSLTPAMLRLGHFAYRPVAYHEPRSAVVRSSSPV